MKIMQYDILNISDDSKKCGKRDHIRENIKKNLLYKKNEENFPS